jgi:hypothetical protein
MNSEWRKSTHSGGANNQCVECGTDARGVLVRDTADRAGAVLAVPTGAWRLLLAEVRAS